MRKKIGTYQIGNFDVEVYVTDQSGGVYRTCPIDKPGLPYLEIGLDHPRWADCFEVLLHEALESTLHRMDVSFEKQAQHTRCAANRWFFFDHAQFAEVCAQVGRFIVACQVDLCTAYRTFLKEEKAKERAARAKKKAQEKPA